jgi:hypothetical protein
MPDDVRSTESSELAGPMVSPRYAGLPTFIPVPYRENPAEIDIALIGVPFGGSAQIAQANFLP